MKTHRNHFLYRLGGLVLLGFLFSGTLLASVEYDTSIPQLAFAAAELESAIEEAGDATTLVTLTIEPDASSPEAFAIRIPQAGQYEVIGTDANGAMYGGIEVAEYLKLELPIETVSRVPFVKKRGIKSNIPMDCRTPSYCDKGTAAQINIANLWDYEGFWAPYLDDLARYRYNVLSLWCTHPYGHMIKVPGYEDTSIEDVYRIKDEYLQPGISNKFEDMDLNHDGILTEEDGTIELVKKIGIDEKIEHWKKVFQHAEDRGIEIYIFHWTVFVNHAKGKYGITEDQANPTTIDFVRKSVEEGLLTYPQIKGIGVTSGENDRRELDGTPDSTENFIRKTYAQGIVDAKKDERFVDRDVRFIFRRHGTEYEWARDAMSDYDGGVVDTSVKYAVAHMYSSRRPQEWENRMVKDGWLETYKPWLNLRNDDLFMHRFGSPDFIRELIRHMPHEEMRGFYTGSDGYFWGREFISKVPELSGQLEIKKHWYNFRMLGEMAYNLELDDAYWKAALKHRFPNADAEQLFDAWESVSEIVPQLNRSVWASTDGAFAPEMCQSSEFLTMDDYYFSRPPMKLREDPPAGEAHCVSMKDWAERFLTGEKANFGFKLSPLEVADNLESYAAAALDVLPNLKEQIGDDIELQDVLLDIESMAYLGQYYADKQRSAAYMMAYRLGGWKDTELHGQSVAHIEQSRDHWKAYADVLESHYKTSLHAKTNWFRWYDRLEDVEKEVAAVKGEGALPVIEFTGLSDGSRFPEGHDLDVTLKVTAANGLDDVRLLLNGVRVGEPIGNSKIQWKAADHPKLADLKADWYNVRAIAVDEKGFLTDKEIYVRVGDPSGARNDWELEPYAVLMTEGQVLFSGHGETDDEREEDQYRTSIEGLDVDFQFDHEGKVVLRDMFYRVPLIRTYSKVGKAGPGPRKCEFVEGVLTTYNLVEPVSMIWTSRNYDRKKNEFKEPLPAEKGFEGPYELVVTRNKNLAIFGMKNDQKSLVWRMGIDWKFWDGRFD